MLKTSRYLHLVPHNGTVAILNALSGGMVFVPPEMAEAVREVTRIDLEDAARRFPELLGIGAFVSDDIDERDLVRVRIGQARFGDRGLNITVVPTLSCNMRCTYCDQPEASRQSAMSEETADAVVAYVKSHLQGRKLLVVTWYGGEPFLAFDRMLSMQQRFYALCAEHGVSLICNITTNGVLVTREKIQALTRVGLRQAQITLDGPQRIHDTRRAMADSSGTFDRILSTVLAIRDLLDVRVRVNVDQQNVSALPELLDVLASNGLQHNTYLAAVVGYTPPCQPGDPHLFSGPDFGRALLHLPTFGSTEEEKQRFVPGTLPCTAPSASTFVFGPRGHVYRCWHDLDDPDRAIDHVLEGGGSPSWRLYWLTYDPLSDPTCAECSLLPLCLGGCPERRRLGIAQPMCCSPLKTHLHEFVKRHAERLMAEQGEPEKT